MYIHCRPLDDKPGGEETVGTTVVVVVGVEIVGAAASVESVGLAVGVAIGVSLSAVAEP